MVVLQNISHVLKFFRSLARPFIVKSHVRYAIYFQRHTLVGPPLIYTTIIVLSLSGYHKVYSITMYMYIHAIPNNNYDYHRS